MEYGKEKGKVTEELIKKYNIDIGRLEREQEKLSKELNIEDSIDFSHVELVAGIDSSFFENKIISGIVLTNVNDFELLENDFSKDKMRFPYIAEFRSYRELPTMVDAFDKLSERPDLVFVKGHGISHPRMMGLASHFSISTGIPTIGIAESLIAGEVKGENVLIGGKIVGKVFHSKKGSKPFYVSPGNLISIDTALELTKKFIKNPHKLPEPLYMAQRYAKKVRKEIR